MDRGEIPDADAATEVQVMCLGTVFAWTHLAPHGAPDDLVDTMTRLALDLAGTEQASSVSPDAPRSR